MAGIKPVILDDPMNALLAGLIALLGLIGLAAVIAPKVKIPAPVLLVVAGIVWALTPGLAPPEIDPHIILSVFLPPLLYSDAWRASWHDFRRWLRPILSLAIGLVAFTIACVGIAAKWAMPDLPWAVCFMIGAMVSPTDTVAIHAVLGRLRVPRRFTAIVGGESLINDATGLLGVQLASIVVLTGVFEASGIAIEFLRISVLGILSGVAVGLLAIAINARLRGTAILFVFSLVAPYLAFGLAEAFGASGVLAVVIAGFVASWRIDLIAAESRVELTADWDVLVFIFNGVMFLFVGLEIPHRLGADPATTNSLLRFGLIVGATVVVARLVWFWPAAYIPLWLFPRLRAKEGGYPPPRAVVLASWCGVRGAVSLAAALSLPLTLPGGTPFPGRVAVEMAVLVTIVVTLIGQGSTVGPLLHLLRIPADPTTEAETRTAREAMLAAGIERLDAFCSDRSCPIAVYRYRDVMTDRLAVLREEEESERTNAAQRLEVSRDVRRAVWKAESDALLRLRDAGEINDRDHQDLQLELDREHAEL
jgi:CPA1 family monovalent cation:H+ antiporter